MTTVLMLTDGSRGATAGARRAVEIFGPHTTYHLASVAPARRAGPGSDNTVVATSDDLRGQRAREAVEATARRLSVPVDCSILRGDPVEVVPRLARRIEADVVVMSPPPGRVGALFAHDAAREALRQLPCSVLLVDGSGTRRAGHHDAAR